MGTPKTSFLMIKLIGNEQHHEKTCFFCIYENKGVDQMGGNHKADELLCSRYIESTLPLLPKSKISNLSAIFCGCTAQYVSDLMGIPKDMFSHDTAHFSMLTSSLDK